MRRVALFFAFSITVLTGCSGIEMNIKDFYVYNPATNSKCKYPINISLEGSFSSKKIILKDDILDISLKELEAKRIFSGVTKKDNSKADIVIELKFSDFAEKKETGLMINLFVRQMPDKKLIYKKKIFQSGTEESLSNPESFADLMKNLITAFIDDIDARFKQFTNEGSLPRNLSAKNVICAVFQFKDSVEKETYAEAITSLVMTNLTKTETIKVIERDRILNAVKGIKSHSSGIYDLNTVMLVGQSLNADFLIYGEITKISESYHITIHVVDVKLGEIVLSRSMETADPDKFSMLVQQHANYVAQFISK